MKILNLGLENIAFQNGSFYRELIEIITRARAGDPTKDFKESIAKEIAVCTAKHTNILVTLEFIDNFNNACIYPALMARDGVQYGEGMSEYMRTYYDELTHLKRGGAIEGLVDAARSRVGGEFAKMTHKSFYDTDFVFGKKSFSPAGAAAVILHETGHAFTFFEYMADTVMINLALQQTYQELMQASDDKEVRLIVERARKRVEIKDPADWVKDVTKADSAEKIIHVLASEAILMRKKTDNKVFYTQDVAEEMAEIFCMRHGGSEGLIEVRRHFAKSHALSGLNFGVMYGAILAAVGILTIPVLGPVSAAAIGLGLLMFGTGNAAAATMPEFTKFSQTIGKVRNQMVEQLKQSNLSAEVQRECLRNIDLAITAVKEVPDDKVPMLVAFWDFFRSDKRAARDWREYTDRLEKLATNDLFIRATKLALKSQSN